MKVEPLVSIIIVNFNGKRYLKYCFDSLYQGSYKNIEIILGDNGSSDGSLEIVRSQYKDIRIVDNEKNLGLSIASNKGSCLASGEYLFFFNNDTIADKGLIANLITAMKSDARLGIAGCKTYTYEGSSLINAGVPCDIFGYPYARGKPFYVDAGIFIRKDLFHHLGGFDEAMFLYGEDRDICWRCWLSGYKVEVVEGAKFFHDSACITENLRAYQTSINKRFWGEFNALRSILKNYSLSGLFFILPLYMFINLSEILVFILKGDFRIVKEAYLKSYKENLRLIKDTLRLRKRIQKQRVVSDFSLIKNMQKISGKFILLTKIGFPKVG